MIRPFDPDDYAPPYLTQSGPLVRIRGDWYTEPEARSELRWLLRFVAEDIAALPSDYAACADDPGALEALAEYEADLRSELAEFTRLWEELR